MISTFLEAGLGLACAVIALSVDSAAATAPAVNLICNGDGVRETMDSRHHEWWSGAFKIESSKFAVTNYTIRLDFDQGNVTVDTPFGGAWGYAEYGRVDAPMTRVGAAELKFDWLLPSKLKHPETNAQVDGFIDRISGMVTVSFIWRDYHQKDENFSVWHEAEYRLKCEQTTTKF